MRVALAQINTTVGDIDGNVRKILETIGRAQALGAGYTLFPELAITGYPPEDLLHKDHFVEANLDALELVSSAYDSDPGRLRGPGRRQPLQRDGDVRQRHGAAALPQADCCPTTACSTRSATSQRGRRPASPSLAAR